MQAVFHDSPHKKSGSSRVHWGVACISYISAFQHHPNTFPMRVTLTSIPVLDQKHALTFYTEKLGFVVKHNQDLGNGHLWLTLVSAEDPEGIEILLEPAPLHFPPAKVFQDAVREAGLPYTQFEVDDVQAEYERLRQRGVEFTMEPKDYGNVKVAIFNDTCGNLIQIVENL